MEKVPSTMPFATTNQNHSIMNIGRDIFLLLIESDKN